MGKMTAAERRERERRKRVEWKAELARLQARRAATADDAPRSRRAANNAAVLRQVIEQLHSNEFRAWFEATTGDPPDEWLSDAAMPPEEWAARHSSSRGQQLDWIRSQIELIADRNYWRNPENRREIGEALFACADHAERRRILIRLATPRWADADAMTRVYLERARLSVETGVPHEVDHIVPLVNRRVCGLHCEQNLRVITAAENRRKSNKFS